LDLRTPSPLIVDEYAIFQQEAWEEVFLQQQRTLIELQQRIEEEKAQLELQAAIEYLDLPTSTITNQFPQTTPQDWQEIAEESGSPYYSPASPTPSDLWAPQEDSDTLASDDDQDSVMFTDEDEIIAELFTPPDSPSSRLSTWSHKLFDTIQETLPGATQYFDHDTQRITVVPPAWKDQVYPNGIHPLDIPQETQNIMEQTEEIEETPYEWGTMTSEEFENAQPDEAWQAAIEQSQTMVAEPAHSWFQIGITCEHGIRFHHAETYCFQCHIKMLEYEKSLLDTQR
jgi:hypothetical protein